VTTVASLLADRAADENSGLLEEGRSLSWADVVAESRRRAAWLCSQHTSGPRHVGILLPNGVNYVLWIFAAALARWTVVGINPTRRGTSLAADILATDCQLLLSDPAGVAVLAGLDLGNAPPPILLAEDAAAEAARCSVDALPDDHDPADLLLLLFTSGTTGTPKAVRCTSGRLARIGQTVVPLYGFSGRDVCYCPMPLFHGNALMALVAPALACGAAIALPPKFSASRFLDDVRTFGATTFTYVGKSIAYLLATEERPDDAVTTLERGFGTEASAADRRRFEARFGCRLVEGYGSSEGGMNITATPETPPGALGPAPATMDLAVVDQTTGVEKARATFDEHGALTNPTEAIGEIVNRSGSGAFEGYYKASDAEAARTRRGWYWSGDLAYRDGQGFFWFAGRAGDWLRVDSENLAASPIEAVLARYEHFAGVAVYAVPEIGGGTGDAVMAAVEMRDGLGLDARDFLAWARRQQDMGTKWIPTLLRVVDRLDETATGKITKLRLQHEAWHTDDVVLVRRGRDEAFELLDAERAAELDALVADARRR
jgi:fatty-acyl-CoA synthase